MSDITGISATTLLSSLMYVNVKKKQQFAVTNTTKGAMKGGEPESPIAYRNSSSVEILET